MACCHASAAMQDSAIKEAREMKNKDKNSNRRATQHRHSAIVERALRPTKKKAFAQILATMPNVGRDKDFERIDDAR